MRYIVIFCILLCACNNSISKQFSGNVYPSVGEIKMGSKTLNSYMKYFGETKINNYTDEFLHFNVICYVGDNFSFLVYEWSNDDNVHQIALKRNRQVYYSFSCAHYKNSHKQIIFDSGLKLGMRRREVLKILGQPARKEFWENDYKFEKGVDIFIFNKNNQNIGSVVKSDDVYFDYTITYDSDNRVNSISANSLYLN